MTPRERIERRLNEEGFTAQDWKDTDDGITAVLGSFIVIEDDEDEGLYSGDEGELTACVVGAPEYGNERVAFAFKVEGFSEGVEVRDLQTIEPVS